MKLMCSTPDITKTLLLRSKTCCYRPSSKNVKKNEIAGTQTDYRESEVQTSPWESPYIVHPGHNPEVLSLANLAWNCGLPAGMHEVEIIERMRIKRAWEATLPPPDCEENVKAWACFIKTVEIDDWAFRESEIQFIMDLRMELMGNLMKTRCKEKEEQNLKRFERFDKFLKERHNRRITNIRSKFQREMRKLRAKYEKKRTQRDIISQYLNPDLFAAEMKFKKPIRPPEVLPREIEEMAIDDAESAREEDIKAKLQKLIIVKPKQDPRSLCDRETRWNKDSLLKLHTDLKSMRLNCHLPKEPLTLLRKKDKTIPLPPTPYRNITSSMDEEGAEKATRLLQTLVKGRAVQCMMFEGRERCRELIEELQSTHALEEHTKKKREKEMANVMREQQQQCYEFLRENRMCEILDSLEGMTVCGMLDFLNKELVRLQDVRRVQAFAMLAERERNKRESEEAGRRQLERHCRREMDEMFKQIMKVNQDSVETYLEDIIKENIDYVAEEDAKQYILDIADKMDLASKHAVENAEKIDEEELVTDMVHNFVLPEVQKQIMRKKIKDKQEMYLRKATEQIFSQVKNALTDKDHESHEWSGEEEQSGEFDDELVRIDNVCMVSSILEEVIDHCMLQLSMRHDDFNEFEYEDYEAWNDMWNDSTSDDTLNDEL